MVIRAEDCTKAVALVEDGRSQRYVAQLLNVVRFLFKEHCNVLGRLEEIHESQAVAENRQLIPAGSSFNLSADVSKLTIRQRLHEVGLKACRTITDPNYSHVIR